MGCLKKNRDKGGTISEERGCKRCLIGNAYGKNENLFFLLLVMSDAALPDYKPKLLSEGALYIIILNSALSFQSLIKSCHQKIKKRSRNVDCL